MRKASRLRAALALGCAALVAAVQADAACCYFAAKDKDISQPGQKAFISWDPVETIESFTVQPKFEGNAVDFGMVIPTPGQPKLDEMPRDFFLDLALYTILMPLPEAIYPQLRKVEYVDDGIVMSSAMPAPSGGAPGKNGVTVLESGVVGSLDYKVLRAEEAAGLYEWLEQNGYVYGGDQQTLDFYIQKKWFFTVMKIDPNQMKKNPDGTYLGEVTPTRFTFESEALVYPLKITQISVPDATEALFYVQAPQQMDLQGDWSWRHSFRVMWLTYMLGCAADPDQQTELQERSAWVEQKKAKDPAFDTTKLEWSRKLGPSDMAVLDEPARNYAQMGGGDLPPGAHVVPLEQFLGEVWAQYTAENWFWNRDDAYARGQLQALQQQYPRERGQIVKVANPGSTFTPTQFMWYPNREAPAAEVQGLSRLRGHLRPGLWLTKFRKVFRKDEMTDDLQLLPVAEAEQQEYVRIMPTSPP